MTPEEYLQQSINLLQHQRIEEAVNLLAEARTEFPKFAALAANHAVALRKLDRQDEAGDALKAACELEPNNPQILFNYANWFFDRSLFDEAELKYREALRVQPELGPAALRLARILARRGDWEKAFPHFITALRTLPQNKQCLELFIKFINEQCPVEGRLQRLRQAGDQAVQNGLLQTAIGVSEYGSGNLDEVEKRAKAALSVPNSKLLLKAKLFTDQKTQEHFLKRFESHGLDADRLILKDFSMVMNDIDIALDPFPFNGATTTFHALWMGLPVITFKGDSHRARVAAAILESVGLSEQCVGETPDDAIEKARKLASDIDALSDLRNELRQRVDQSPIRDGKDFAHKFEAALIEMWNAKFS